MGRRARQYHDLSRPIREFRFVVDRTEVGRRVDALLRAHYPWNSRTHYQRMLERGEVLIGTTVAKASTRVRFGDEVIVRLPEDPALPARETADDLVVLYEDAHLVVLDKPSGMAAHPVGRIRHGTLVNKLHARYRHEDPARDRVPRLGHRLDRGTSGVVLAVLDREADAAVTELFTRRDVEKTYLALVVGTPAADTGVIDAPLGPALDAETKVQQGVRPDGLPSRSSWRVRERFAGHALLEMRPHTGRSHQLRVHLAHAGFPIACDPVYGDPQPLVVGGQPVLARLGLHSHRLVLEHPVTGAPLDLVSPLPADMAAAVAALRADGTA